MLSKRARWAICLIFPWHRKSLFVLLFFVVALCGPATLSAQEAPPRRFGLPKPISEFWPEVPAGEERTDEAEAEVDEIETDRDSFTPATTTTARGRFIVESAYSFIDNRSSYDTHSFPETVARFGINEWLEGRIHWNYEVGGAGNTISSESGSEEFESPGIERETQIGYGFKARINKQNGLIPESAFLAIGNTPTSGPDTASSFVGTYVFGWKTPQKWKFDAAIRYSVDSEKRDGFNVWAPSAVLKVPVWESVDVHAEYFGVFSQNRERNSNAQYFSPGLHYLLTKDLEIGFRLGWGLNDDAAKFFVNSGISLRF